MVEHPATQALQLPPQLHPLAQTRRLAVRLGSLQAVDDHVELVGELVEHLADMRGQQLHALGVNRVHPPGEVVARRFDMKAFVEEYGSAGVGVYFAIFFGCIGVFYVLLSTGLSGPLEGLWSALHGWGWVESPTLAGASAGFLGLAYLLTKALQPVRIGATLALTPLVVRVRRGEDDAAPVEEQR